MILFTIPEKENNKTLAWPVAGSKTQLKLNITSIAVYLTSAPV